MTAGRDSFFITTKGRKVKPAWAPQAATRRPLSEGMSHSTEEAGVCVTNFAETNAPRFQWGGCACLLRGLFLSVHVARCINSDEALLLSVGADDPEPAELARLELYSAVSVD